MVQLKLESVVNEKLFSRNYLEEKLVETSKWETDEELEKAFEKAKQIYENNKEILPTLTNNEAQLEDVFIKPVFEDVLGHYFAVQETTHHTKKQPDYGFFKNEEVMKEAFKNKGDKDFYQNSIAVGDAKAWDKELDKGKGRSGIFDDRNPSFQIDYYLRETPPSWGILTNGRKWRLYYEERSHRMDTYYEVDLIDIIEKDDIEAFKYFYLFFRRGAFTPVGDSFLDDLFQQSLKYSQEIGEDLEDNIYQALLWMAKGYFNMKSNELDKTEENLDIVHKNSLIFLYRLLFLFYADNNELIPSDLPGSYDREYSFSTWVEDILWDIHQGNVSHGGGLYNHRLFRIFQLINEGSEGLGVPKEDFYVPPYNGGLFDPEKHQFLTDKKIQDGYIARVVELLAKADEAEKEEWLGGRIDYSDLSLRHIGGIYEGLLEHELKIADEDIVAEKDNKTLKWKPLDEGKKDFEDYDEDMRAREGEIYLATDKGERKATGSYYTPEYIVEYIVENTVDPLIEEKIEKADTEEEIREEILSTKILDPAIGSGHFLIDAIDSVGAKLSKYAPVEEIEDEREIDWAKREVARNCIYGVDVNPLATELAKVSVWLNTLEQDKPLSFIDHHLKTGNSLIGADIHDLDKHPDEEVEKNGQSALTSFLGVNVTDRIKELLTVYKGIVNVIEEEAKDIKEEEALYKEFEEHTFRKKFETLANIYTSYFFDNDFSISDYEELLKAFKEDSDKWNELLETDWVNYAQGLADNKDFFHWKLEFPEVFFDVENGTEKNNPGFDAVIGNPPYFDIETKLSQAFKNYLNQNFNVYTGSNDICYFFYEKSFKLLQEFGEFGMITSRYFQEAKYGKKLRKYLTRFNLKKIIDFGSEVKVFRTASGEEITIHTLIYLGTKESPQNQVKIIKFNEWHVEKNNVKELVGLIKDIEKSEIIEDDYRVFNLENKDFDDEKWNLEPKIFSDIIEKLEKAELRLGDEGTDKESICYVGQSIQSGLDKIETERGEVGVFRVTSDEIDSKNLEKELLLPLIKTAHLRRYLIKENKEYLIYTTPDTNIDEYPNIKKHLLSFKDELKERYDIKNSSYPWFSIANLRNRELFEKKSYKLLWPMVSPYNRFVIKEKKENLAFTGDIYYGVPKSDFEDDTNNIFYLAGIANSKLLEFYHQKTAKATNWGYSYGATYVSAYPIMKYSLKNRISEKILKYAKDINKKRSEEYEEIRKFLEWTTREWSTKIEDLSLKTHLREYWKYDFDEMLRIAKKNKSSIKGDPSSRKFQERLKEELQNSIEVINPLQKEIQKLENEIDALVFELYEINEEEVKTILDSLNTPENERKNILERFRNL
ncbi:MAG: Eco57I restriction-modification methylase domain-containing protein [Elusimicrobiota bacterium]